jgi:hypothetical protein
VAMFIGLDRACAPWPGEHLSRGWGRRSAEKSSASCQLQDWMWSLTVSGGTFP